MTTDKTGYDNYLECRTLIQPIYEVSEPLYYALMRTIVLQYNLDYGVQSETNTTVPTVSEAVAEIIRLSEKMQLQKDTLDAVTASYDSEVKYSEYWHTEAIRFRTMYTEQNTELSKAKRQVEVLSRDYKALYKQLAELKAKLAELAH